MEFHHESVLLQETVEYLNVRPDGTYVDGTLGGGGHAWAIASLLGGGGRLYGIDRDADAIRAAKARLGEFGDRVAITRANFCDMDEVLRGFGVLAADGIVLDLGVSSYQLDEPSRGFTYRDPGAPLDMRMDDRQEATARDIVNGYGEEELCRILRDYGEERYARNIAREIIRRREGAPLETAGDLSAAVWSAIPKKARAAGGHPEKRTFQAIRIELNGELDALEKSLDMMVGLLSPGGRICVITFHSLEDRIVKQAFRRYERPCTCPPDFPVCVCGKKPLGRVITPKPVLPGERELGENKRSSSAKLRVFERGENANPIGGGKSPGERLAW